MKWGSGLVFLVAPTLRKVKGAKNKTNRLPSPRRFRGVAEWISLLCYGYQHDSHVVRTSISNSFTGDFVTRVLEPRGDWFDLNIFRVCEWESSKNNIWYTVLQVTWKRAPSVWQALDSGRKTFDTFSECRIPSAYYGRDLKIQLKNLEIIKVIYRSLSSGRSLHFLRSVKR